MTLTQPISPSLYLRSPLLPFRIPRFQTRTRTRYRRRRSHLRIRSSLDDLFKTLISSNPADLIPAALTLASTAALYLTQRRVSGPSPEPVIADWILFTSPTPFNRCVLLRCPSISFEDGEESDKLLREERHYVNLSRGRIFARNGGHLELEEEEEEIGYQRVCVGTEDGGVVSLDWPENLDLGREYGLDTTVLIVPGTAEGSMDKDVRRFVFDVLRSGCFPVVMNPRGCAGSPLTTARLFTAADSDDICTVIKYINRLRPWTTLMGVGLGYGANMLTKYLAEVGESTPVTASVCIDNPFDLDEATRSLPYHMAADQKLTGGLIEILRVNKELFQGKAKGYNLAKALSATSLRDFDKAVSMVSYGFDTVEDFYSMTSTRELVNKVKVPILFIQSDDGIVPPFSVPRSSIAENPFTSLLVCSCHASAVNRVKGSAIIWCQQLTIEDALFMLLDNLPQLKWLSAVELAFLKGRHPLLKDVDITINPSKGLSFINVEASEENIEGQDRTRGIYDSAQWLFSPKNAKNDTFKTLTSSNTVNGFLNDRFVNEKAGMSLSKSNSYSNSDIELGMMQNGDLGIKEDGRADASENNSANGGFSPTDTEESQVLQTAAVIMNMLDVTMPGTLDEEKKRKVLTAMGQGETLMKALEGAVPDEVRGKLTTAVTEIMQTQSTNLKFNDLRRIGWINKVTSGKPRIQEKSKETSTTVSGQDDTCPSELRKNVAEGDGKTQESIESAARSTEPSQDKAAQDSANVETGTEVGGRTNQSNNLEEASYRMEENNSEQNMVNQSSGKGGKTQETTESAAKSSEASQDKAAHSSVNFEAGTEVGSKLNQPNKLEEASSRMDENNSEQNNVHQSSGKDGKHSADDQVPDDENDFQNTETRKVSSPAGQNISTSSTNSEEASSTGLSNSDHKVDEKESDAQKNENKITQDGADQNVQSSTKPEEHLPQRASSKPPSISVTQALDALTGFDDSTQMAVNNVFEVIEDMIDQFEKASNKNDDEIDSNENHELKNRSEKEDDNNHTSGIEPDVEPSNFPENNLEEEDAKSYDEVNGNLKKVKYSLTSSVNNSIGRVKESNTVLKDLYNRNLSKVCHVQNFPQAVNQYWESPYAACLQRCFSTQLPKIKSIDVDSATDLFLDPEEGQWKMIDQPGDSKSTSTESGENQCINGKDQTVHKIDIEDIIDPSYVILDNKFSRLHESAEAHDAAYDKHDDGKGEFTHLIRNALLDALKIEVGRKLGEHYLEDLESSLVYDLELFADTISQAVVRDSALNMDSFSESGNTATMKFGRIEAKHIIKTISSAVSGASHLRKVLPLGVIVGSSLASLRTYFQVVSLHDDDDQNEAVDESTNMQENSYSQESKAKKEISADKKDHVDSHNHISKGHEKLQTDRLNNGGIMVGAVTAALGASALLAHHELKEIHEHDENLETPSVPFKWKSSPHDGDVKLEDAMQDKKQNNLVSSLAEKAMSVASPMVPTKSGGEVDQERLVAVLAELVQKGGVLRLVGKVALLWGGIRGAMSLTDKLISFLHIADRPLSHRVLGFVGMALVLWSPIVIPLLPTIIQSWTIKTSNSIVNYACITGLYVAITILIVLWGKRIRGYEHPLQQYGLELTSASRVQDFCKGLVGGIVTILCIHSISAFLGYAKLSLSRLPSPSEGALALLNSYGNILILAIRGATAAIGIATVEELLFRSWLAEEIAADLGYYRAIIISGLAFSLSQRSLPSIPGFFLLSLALFGMKQRTQGNLAAPIGMRAGIMTTNFIMQAGGFFTYSPSTPLWLANSNPCHPFEGAIGLGSCAILAIFFYPKPLKREEMPTNMQDVQE